MTRADRRTARGRPGRDPHLRAPSAPRSTRQRAWQHLACELSAPCSHVGAMPRANAQCSMLHSEAWLDRRMPHLDAPAPAPQSCAKASVERVHCAQGPRRPQCRCAAGRQAGGRLPARCKHLTTARARDYVRARPSAPAPARPRKRAAPAARASCAWPPLSAPTGTCRGGH